jgi:hypothetical protein
MLTERTERCAVARGEPDGGHAAQHLSNIKMASRRLCPPYGSQRHVARMSAATCGDPGYRFCRRASRDGSRSSGLRSVPATSVGDRPRGRPRISLLPALFELRQSLLRATKLRDLLWLAQLRRRPYDPRRFVGVIANPNRSATLCSLLSFVHSCAPAVSFTAASKCASRYPTPRPNSA